MDRADQFAQAVGECYARGWISAPVCVEPGVWAASQTGHGWGMVAYGLAAHLPGQVWPGRRSCSWVCGRGGPHGRLLEVDDVTRCRDANSIALLLGVQVRFPWSMGRIARAILSHVCDPETCPQSECLLDGMAQVGYHDCLPGNYRNVTMFDVHSYYHDLLTRAPSLRVMAGRSGGVFWHPMTDAERGRWKDALQAVEACKVLRNSLVGCAMGAAGKRPVFVRDPDRPGRAIRKTLTLPGGPHRGLGLLIVRSAYELCYLASCEANSVYSTIDSVTSESALPPKVWTRLGLEVDVKASGPADIRRRGCWKIGPRQTKPYEADYRLAVGVAKPDAPPVMYHRAWLN